MSRRDFLRVRPAGRDALHTARAILEQLGRLDDSVTIAGGDCWLRWTTLIARTFLRDPAAAAAALAQLRAVVRLAARQRESERLVKVVESKCSRFEGKLEALIAEPSPAARRAKASRRRGRSTRSATKGRRAR